jgi:hypothetical protein
MAPTVGIHDFGGTSISRNFFIKSAAATFNLEIPSKGGYIEGVRGLC